MEKILVIEDEPQIRANIQEILALSEFETIAAPEGLTGVQMAKDYIPDLIICDIMMPELTGYEVLTAIRQDEVTSTIPLIFLTAQTHRSEMRRGMEYGAADYLMKPFSPSELLRAVTTQLVKREASRRVAETKLDRLRTNISMALPHELYTPLNGILGMSELLADQDHTFSANEVCEMAQIIQTSARRLCRLTQNFLLYAELEVIASNPEKVQQLRKEQKSSFAKSAISSIAQLKAQQAGRDKDLQLDLQNLPLPISEERLSKVVEELIDNAFKFSQPGTLVKVCSWFDGSTFTLHIIDHGRGMTADQVANLGAYMQFERKYYEQQGSGLGLVIAKRLVELHGGVLTISSIPEEQTIVQIIFHRQIHR
ncbi:MAG: hybrid sensor histidine kinase/response regulator [Leptolyngbyaceae cyanobacterium CSU_1_3]|nr:hybrid sensor histidine kinase/response regulator [Leptolyngbyaceae cyanobacterium CSU_1_3]